MSLIVLPGTVVVFIPAVLLYISATFVGVNHVISQVWYHIFLSLIFFFIGSLLAFLTVRLFLTKGKGTPAPWDPPKKLVVLGPYRFVRNPMITGVLFLLAGESLLFSSWLLFFWMLLFFLANLIYLPFFEEKSLLRRFGKDYQDYKEHVPRWIPRLIPYCP